VILPDTRKPSRDSTRARTSPAYSWPDSKAPRPTVITLTERTGSSGGAGREQADTSIAAPRMARIERAATRCEDDKESNCMAG
jgi:hypothetical protein